MRTVRRRSGTTHWARPLWWIGGLGILAAIAWIGGLRLNLTRSMPVGLYRVTRGMPTRGTMVLVCLPPVIAAFAGERGYLPRGGTCAQGTLPIGKVVLGVSGDTITVLATGLLLNGVPVPHSQARVRDHRGRALPRVPCGVQVLGPGTLWLYSPYSAWSFDSRYFGPVSITRVITRVQPLWTTRQPDLR